MEIYTWILKYTEYVSYKFNIHLIYRDFKICLKRWHFLDWFFSHGNFLSFSTRRKYLFKSQGMNITVRNMEIDLNSNIPQLMSGVLFFQGGTVRQYISAPKYMIILKLL